MQRIAYNMLLILYSGAEAKQWSAADTAPGAAPYSVALAAAAASAPEHANVTTYWIDRSV